MTKNKYNGPRLHLGLIEEAKISCRQGQCFTNYNIFNMDFGQDLEPEELTKHYDQCHGIDFETEEEEDEEYDG